MKCSICLTAMRPSTSNNARPINNGRCCHACDDLIVSAVRIAQMGVPIVACIENALAMHKAVKAMRAAKRAGIWGRPKKGKQ